MRDGQGQVDPVCSQPSSAGAIQTTCNGQSSQSHRSSQGEQGTVTEHVHGPLSGNSENRESENRKIAHMLTDDGLNTF